MCRIISDKYNCNQNKYYISVLLIDLQLPMQSAPILTKVVSSNLEIFDGCKYVFHFNSKLYASPDERGSCTMADIGPYINPT